MTKPIDAVPDITITAWGSDAAIKLPADVVSAAGLAVGTAVRLEVLPDGSLRIIPTESNGTKNAKPDIDALVAAAHADIEHAKAAGIDPYEMSEEEEAWDRMKPVGDEH